MSSNHRWAPADAERAVGPREATAIEPQRLAMPPQSTGLARAGIAERAAAVGALQRSVGNHAVAAMLMRNPGPVPAHVKAEPKWKLDVKPGGVAAGQPRSFGDPAKIFRGDTLLVTATWAGLKTSEQGLIDLRGSGPSELPTPTGKWISKSSYQWSIPIMQMGSHRVQLWSTVEAMLTAMKDVTVNVVTDVTDLGLRASAASDIATKKFAAAMAAIGDATVAWTTAYNRHAKALKAADAAEKLESELLWGLFFATLGGGAGGALGGWLKNVSKLKALGDKKQTFEDIIVGGVTDAAKDTLKYAVRSSRKIQSGGSSLPETSGDSTDAPQAGAGGGGARFEPAGDDPSIFLGKLHSQLGVELGALAGQLGDLKLKASDARAANKVIEFDQDPVTLVERDTKLELLTKDLKTEPKDYLHQLWGKWLATHAYKIGPGRPLHIDMEPNLDEEIKQYAVHKNISSQLNNTLRAEAAFCGTTLEKWMDEFTPGLRKRLEDEAKAKNTAEWNQYWGEKAEQERKRREAEERMMDMD